MTCSLPSEFGIPKANFLESLGITTCPGFFFFFLPGLFPQDTGPGRKQQDMFTPRSFCNSSVSPEQVSGADPWGKTKSSTNIFPLKKSVFSACFRNT